MAWLAKSLELRGTFEAYSFYFLILLLCFTTAGDDGQRRLLWEAPVSTRGWEKSELSGIGIKSTSIPITYLK